MSDPKPQGDSFAALFEATRPSASRARSKGVGDELDVVVAQIGKDAVFVDLDEKEQGFIESKDLTSESGELTVKVGSRLRARVAEVGGRPGATRLVPLVVRDMATGAVASVAPAAGASIAVGARIKGNVVEVERYGIFVQWGPATPRPQRGLVPTTELGVPRNADLHKLYPKGAEIEAKVVAIDERGRIRLSVTALADDDERKAYETFTKGGDPKKPLPTRSFGTLGDLLAKASQKKK